MNQFADDMDIFSLCKETSLRAIHKELEHFRLQSGFTVSYDKTTIYRIGSLRYSSAMLYNMSEFVWSNEDITVLGVKIAQDNIVEKNYDGILEKAKSILDAWYNRGLSLMGKVQVVNTLIASLFVYKMMVLPIIPDKIIKDMNSMIRDFIWNKGKSKIAYNILQLPKSEGGLGLVHLRRKELSLKATWPQILASEEEYANVVYGLMKCSVLRSDIWRVSIAPDDVKLLKIRQQFWSEVLHSWSQYNYYRNTRIENQILWYNSQIRIRGSPFLWGDVYRSGLKYVYQLFSDLDFKTEEQVWTEYGLSRLRYNSLKTAIPREWRDYFRTYEQQQFYTFTPT